uniref:Uncharacterized protein n=1 Tax=Arundo donax TaxID=35708 RepID=A0A0A8ZV06_ARUDO
MNLSTAAPACVNVSTHGVRSGQYAKEEKRKKMTHEPSVTALVSCSQSCISTCI